MQMYVKINRQKEVKRSYTNYEIRETKNFIFMEIILTDVYSHAFKRI